MTDDKNNHPLTETDAAELWDAHWDTGRLYWEDTGVERGVSNPHILDALRAAFDAGREHERAQADQTLPDEITDEMVEAAARASWDADDFGIAWDDLGNLSSSRLTHLYATRIALSVGLSTTADPHSWESLTTDDALRTLIDAVEAWQVTDEAAEDGRNMAPLAAALAGWEFRRISATEKESTMTEPTARTLLAVPAAHGAPHHDGGKIKPGDFVMQVDRRGVVRHGLAHHQDTDGDWCDEIGQYVTWSSIRADRPDAVTVWPAPTPPAVEVTLPTEFGAVIKDVEVDFGKTFRFNRMVWTGNRWTFWDYSTIAEFIISCTLPDGTRARRDGDRADGTPRFVKEASK